MNVGKRRISQNLKIAKLNKGNFRDANSAPINMYSKDFKLTSKETKAKKSYKCEECGINMSEKKHQKYCHTHHVDGDKSNNSSSNLQVLCIGCHAKQPVHAHVKNNPDYRKFMARTNGSAFRW